MRPDHRYKCPYCGVRGAHFCTGGQKPHPGYSENFDRALAKRRKEFEKDDNDR